VLRNANGDNTGFGNSKVTLWVGGKALYTNIQPPAGSDNNGYLFSAEARQDIQISYQRDELDQGNNQFYIVDNSGNMLAPGAITSPPSGYVNYGQSPDDCDCEFAMPDPVSGQCPDGIRIRREWRSLSLCDQMNYINAVKLLKLNGVYDAYTITHRNQASVVHGNAWFLPWHREFVYQYESDIRAMGGTYSCVALPYWDWTLDSGHELQSSIFNNLGFFINDSCIGYPFSGYASDGSFATWTNPATAKCVIRNAKNCTFGLPLTSFTQMQTTVSASTTYKELEQGIEGYPHGTGHNFVGGCGGDMASMASPADPLFWLNHGMVDRFWALWQDCWDSDKVPANSYTIDQYNPDAYSPQVPTNRNMRIDIDKAFIGMIHPGTRTTRDVLNIETMGYTYTSVGDAYNWIRADGQACAWDWFRTAPQSFLEFTKIMKHLPAAPAGTQVSEHIGFFEHKKDEPASDSSSGTVAPTEEPSVDPRILNAAAKALAAAADEAAAENADDATVAGMVGVPAKSPPSIPGEADVVKVENPNPTPDVIPEQAAERLQEANDAFQQVLEETGDAGQALRQAISTECESLGDALHAQDISDDWWIMNGMAEACVIEDKCHNACKELAAGQLDETLGASPTEGPVLDLSAGTEAPTLFPRDEIDIPTILPPTDDSMGMGM